MKFAPWTGVCLVPAVAACAIPDPPAFYGQPALASAAHGSLIAAQPYTPTLRGAAAYRVL